MKKRITNAKIACLDINLQKARMQLGVQILVDDPNQLEEIRKRSAAPLVPLTRLDFFQGGRNHPRTNSQNISGRG